MSGYRGPSMAVVKNVASTETQVQMLQDIHAKPTSMMNLVIVDPMNAISAQS